MDFRGILFVNKLISETIDNGSFMCYISSMFSHDWFFVANQQLCSMQQDVALR